jgi:hypothetical protein
MGTLAVVILAKQQGLIESAAQVMYDLRSNDFHLDDAIIREALAPGNRIACTRPGRGRSSQSARSPLFRWR